MAGIGFKLPLLGLSQSLLQQVVRLPNPNLYSSRKMFLGVPPPSWL